MEEEVVLSEFLNSVKTETIKPKVKILEKTPKTKIDDGNNSKNENSTCDLSNASNASNGERSKRKKEKIEKETYGLISYFTEVDNKLQPSKDRHKGRLMAGPGARIGGVQPRPMELRRAFYKLDGLYEMKLGNARKYAMEQNVSHVLAKQREEQNKIKKDPLANSALKQQVLSLMSRVYVGGINFDVKEDAIRQAFTNYGIIKKIDFSWEVVNVKHKGFAFVEYEVPDMAQLVLNSNTYHLIHGRPAKVGRPSNMPQATPFIDVVINESKKYPRVFISNIHSDINDEDLKSVFEAFGPVVSIDMPIDLGTMKHKGYAFIEYMDHKAANDSVVAMNRFDIGGQLLRVGRSISLPNETKKTLNPSDIVNKIRNEQKNAEDVKKKSNEEENDVKVKPEYYEGTKFEDKELENVKKDLNDEKNIDEKSEDNESVKSEENEKELKKAPDGTLAAEEIVSIKGTDQRFIMMKKLAALRKQKNNILVLKNMILPDEIDDELEDEIKEECVKYGKITSVLIKSINDIQSNQEVVKVFIEYESEDDAKIAKDALNGRYFGGRIISVEIYDGMKFKYGDYSG